MNDLNTVEETQNDSEDIRAALVSAMRDDEGADPSPSAEPVAEGRSRDDLGRFAKQEPVAETVAPETPEATGTLAPDPAATDPAATDPALTLTAEPAAPAAIRPPPGWEAPAKAAFDALPDVVKAAVAKREDEVNRGFQKLADYKGLDPWADAYREAGYTLPEVLTQFTQADQRLRTNFTEGVVALCEVYNKSPADLARHLTVAFGLDINSPTGSQPAPSNQPDVQALIRNELKPLQETVNGFTKERDDRRRADLSNKVDAFFDDPANRYADNVIHLMVPLMQEGATLEEAYEKAKWQDASVREQLINERLHSGPQATATPDAKASAASKAKAASKSVSGAPGSGSAPTLSADTPLREMLKQQLTASRV